MSLSGTLSMWPYGASSPIDTMLQASDMNCDRFGRSLAGHPAHGPRPLQDDPLHTDSTHHYGLVSPAAQWPGPVPTARSQHARACEPGATSCTPR